LIEDGVPLVAHPGPLQQDRAASEGPVHLAVGPEGGFSDYEIEKFESQGFERISLGDRILRVETAVPFLVAQLLKSGNR
jgi:16S rRNA (uracil1498-N3)-methyltransferase